MSNHQLFDLTATWCFSYNKNFAHIQYWQTQKLCAQTANTRTLLTDTIVLLTDWQTQNSEHWQTLFFACHLYQATEAEHWSATTSILTVGPGGPGGPGGPCKEQKKVLLCHIRFSFKFDYFANACFVNKTVFSSPIISILAMSDKCMFGLVAGLGPGQHALSGDR